MAVTVSSASEATDTTAGTAASATRARTRCASAALAPDTRTHWFTSVCGSRVKTANHESPRISISDGAPRKSRATWSAYVAHNSRAFTLRGLSRARASGSPPATPLIGIAASSRRVTHAHDHADGHGHDHEHRHDHAHDVGLVAHRLRSDPRDLHKPHVIMAENEGATGGLRAAALQRRTGSERAVARSRGYVLPPNRARRDQLDDGRLRHGAALVSDDVDCPAADARVKIGLIRGSSRRRVWGVMQSPCASRSAPASRRRCWCC